MNSFTAWRRRFWVAGITAVTVYFVSIGVAIYLAINYQIWNPWLERVSNWDIQLKELLSRLAQGTWVAEFVTNEFRERFNLVHFFITFAVVLTIGVCVGWLVNKLLKGTRTLWERFKISALSLPLGVVFTLTFFSMKLWSPGTYGLLMDVSHAGWMASRWFLKWFDAFQPIGYFLSFTLQHPFGHSVMFATLGNMFAILCMNIWYALKVRSPR